MIPQKAAIYHFSNTTGKRPIIYEKELEALKAFAETKGFEVSEVFFDTSLERRKRKEFDRFLASADKFDVLVTKDFYHISKNTCKCLKDMKELRNRGVRICSVENGTFALEDPPLDRPLRDATYVCANQYPDDMHNILTVQNEILDLYIRKKTNWILVDQYSDVSTHNLDVEQTQLPELIMNRNKYDILLVHDLNSIHWRTAKFCKKREALGLDILSLQDGFLKYRTA